MLVLGNKEIFKIAIKASELTPFERDIWEEEVDAVVQVLIDMGADIKWHPAYDPADVEVK